MRTRRCPSCYSEFRRCKRVNEIRTCPCCAIQIHYINEDTILYEDKLQAARLVAVLEEHISKRDRIEFEFEGASKSKELHLAYSIIDRARKYLARQVDIGLTALEFCLEIVTDILGSEFWGRVTKSFAYFMKHISDFAKEVFVRRRDAIEQLARDREASALADFLDYKAPESKEDIPCFQVATM